MIACSTPAFASPPKQPKPTCYPAAKFDEKYPLKRPVVIAKMGEKDGIVMFALPGEPGLGILVTTDTAKKQVCVTELTSMMTPRSRQQPDSGA